MSQLSLKSLSERSIHTSTVPGAKLYIICPRGHAKIYCPWGQAVHPLSQRSGCTSTVPGSGSTSTVPEVRLTSVPGSSCTSTVPEVRLYIYCPWVKLYIHCPRGQAVHPLTSSPVSTDGGVSAELVEGSLFSSLCKLAGQQKSNRECHCHAQFTQAKAVLLQFFGHKLKKLSNGKGVFCCYCCLFQGPRCIHFLIFF